MTTPERVWSKQQKDIFRWFHGGSGNAVVRARAGTGKTTTIIEAISYAAETSILLCAFNKRIQQELQKRITNPHAKAQTLHSVGYAAVRRYWEGLNIASGQDRALDLANWVCGTAPDAMKKLVAKLHSKGREIKPHARLLGELTELAIEFECEPDDDWRDDGFDLAWVEGKALDAMELAATRKPTDAGIDFADMIFLPVRNHWLRPEYDMVVVDEAQDMTNAQLEISTGVCKGRICVVGDDRQAIYAFRGADADSLDRLKAELKATEFGLTTTYRCGKVIVAAAAKYVPDFQADANNPDGEERSLNSTKLAGEAAHGDFVLSRTNAPLVGTAMALIKLQKRARIAGREIGTGLKAIIAKLTKGAGGRSVPEFLKRLVVWEQKSLDRARAANNDDKAQLIADQSEVLQVLADGVVSVREIEDRIDALFTDDGLGEKNVITCSSIHKAKGLEADRVYLLQDTFKTGRTDKQRREEENLRYVGITRAKLSLVWVSEFAPVEPPPAAKQAPLLTEAGK